MNDPIAGVDTDSLVKKDGRWQFRDDGRKDAKDECGPTEQDWADYGEYLASLESWKEPCGDEELIDWNGSWDRD